MVPLNDIYNVLQENGVEDTLGFHWNVVSTDGQLSTEASNGPRYVVFDIGYMLSNTEELGIPNVFALHQNYPNPFNPTTEISFSMEQTADVSLTVFNMLGQSVRVLENASLEAGTHSYKWDGRDELGQSVSTGVYLYTLTDGTKSITKKMALMK